MAEINNINSREEEEEEVRVVNAPKFAIRSNNANLAVLTTLQSL